jgi:hypothetical protein
MRTYAVERHREDNKKLLHLQAYAAREPKSRTQVWRPVLPVSDSQCEYICIQSACQCVSE